VVGGLEYVGQNKMCCNLCRLVGGIAALFILRRVGILSVVLMFVYRLSDTVSKSVSEPIKKHSLKILLVL
jgi:hypothetical protein